MARMLTCKSDRIVLSSTSSRCPYSKLGSNCGRFRLYLLKELSTILADKTSPSLADVLFAQTSANLLEKAPDFGLIGRLPP